MKVMIPQSAEHTLNTETGESSITVKGAAVSFSEEKNGKYVAAVKLAFPNSGKEGDTRRPVITTRLTLEADTSRSSKGVRRSMFRASMPYVSMKAADELITSPIEPDASRSGAEMSVHTVVAMPRSADTDMSGASGSIGRNGAVVQLRLLGAALNALAGAITQALSTNGGGDTEGLVLTSLKEEEKRLGELDSTVMAVKVGDAPQHLQMAVDAQECGVEIDLSGLAKEFCLESPLGRALNGLKPIRDDETIAIETEFTRVKEIS